MDYGELGSNPQSLILLQKVIYDPFFGSKKNYALSVKVNNLYHGDTECKKRRSLILDSALDSHEKAQESQKGTNY